MNETPVPSGALPPPEPIQAPGFPAAPEFPPAPPAPAPEPVPPRRPGPLSIAAWIAFFGGSFALVYGPLLAHHGSMDALIPKPGVLDDPRMIATGIASSWLTFAVAAVLVWRARLARADIGWMPLSLGRLVAWTAIAIVGLAAIWTGASVIFRDRLAIVEPLTRPPQGAANWMLWMALAFTSGITEEYVMRGYGVGFLKRLGVNRWLAAIAVSALFGSLHIYEGVAAVPLLALWGLMFAAVFLATGSLLPGILAHAVVNGMAPFFIGPVR